MRFAETLPGPSQQWLGTKGIAVKVFAIDAPEGFEWVLPVRAEDYDLLRFDGQPRATSWSSVPMRRVLVDERGTRREPSDFPSCSGGEMLIIRQRAVDALSDLLLQSGEVLPLRDESEAPLFAFNVTRVVDVLDEERSQLLRNGAGKILRIERPAFRLEALAHASASIFKVTQLTRGLRAIPCARSAQLNGISFRQVWAAD